MKKLLLSLAGAALLLAACTPQELSNQALKDRLDQVDKDIAGLQEDVSALKTAVSQINSNIAALQSVVTALQSNVYVKEVTPIKDGNNNVIGYTIQFTDNTSVAIYHGEKGDKGDKGDQGEQGPQGPAGTDGTTPVIGVKDYDGTLYWTVNGEWLKDDQGKLVPVTGKDGATGATGQDGKTPQLRINEGNWEVSYDGQTWTVVGPAQTPGESVDVVFKGVKETKDQVIFTLTDDTKLAIDKLVEFSLKIDDSQAYEVVEGKSTLVPYTLSGVGKGESRVDAVASGDWWADVVVDNKEGGAVKVTAGTAAKAKVIVYAVDGKGRSDMRSLIFEGGSLVATAPVEDSPTAGGEVEVPVVTNVDYIVDIEEDAQYWLSYAITKAGEVHKETLVLYVEKNNLPETRSGWVRLRDTAGAVIQEFEVKQESGVYEYPEFEDSNFKNWVLYNSPAADYNENMKVDASEAAKVTEITIAADKAYTSLKGIECFYNLKKITIKNTTKLASVDLSKNKKLEDVTIEKSYGVETVLTTLDLSDLHALKNVQVGGLSAIETISLGSAPKLASLYAYNTALNALDVTKAPELLNVAVYGTKIATLDLSKNAKLESANVGATTLASLTLPAEPAIKVLNLDNAALTELDMSTLTDLTEFSASATKMVSIDLSNSAKLVKFSVGSYGTGTSNSLETVDVRKATALSSVNLYSSVLKEVFVPKGTKTSSWNWTSYHSDPDTGAVTYVKVTEIEGEGGDEPQVDDYAAGIKEPFVKKIVLGKFDKDGNGAIDATEAEAVKELDLSECGLEDGDLAGLEVFPIAKLLLNGNKFTQFDVLAWPNLEWLNLNDNKLTALSIGKNYTDLKQNLHLEAARNQIATFTGPSYYAKINYLDLSGNQLASFSSPYPTALEFCDLSNNALASVSMSGASKLAQLNVSNNKLSSVAFSGFSKLVKVDVSHNNLSAYSFSASQTALAEVNLGYNKFTQLDITSVVKSTALKKIDLTGNDDFALLIIGSGNTLPETLEIAGVKDYGVLNASMPTGELVTNKYNSISKIEGGEEVDMTINFSKEIKAYKVAAGQTLTITAASAKKGIKFFAIGAGCTPKVTVSRGDEGKVYDKTDVSSRSENPATLRKNETTGDLKKVVVDGNDDQLKYYLGPVTYSSSGGIAAGDTVILTVSGENGETAIIFGINLDTYRDDEV